jgi:hypothetical protein
MTSEADLSFIIFILFLGNNARQSSSNMLKDAKEIEKIF